LGEATAHSRWSCEKDIVQHSARLHKIDQGLVARTSVALPDSVKIHRPRHACCSAGASPHPSRRSTTPISRPRIPRECLTAAFLGYTLAAPCVAQTGGAAALPLVWVLSTGGTISARGSSATDLSNYRTGALLGEELVKSVPEISRVATVKVEQIVNVSSPDITTDNWLTIARRINAIFADPAVAGVVVTQGTNTLEETAYFLNLTVKSDRPVVLVGSMRPSTAISADGPLNLLNAIRTATSAESKG